MTRIEFLTGLANRLGDVPVSERRAALDFYNNYFDDAAEAGRSEEEVTASLEPPAQIAARIRAEFAFRPPGRAGARPLGAGRVIAAIFGILTLPLTLPAAAAVFALGLSLAVAAAAVLISAAAVVAACAGSAFFLGANAVALIVTGAGTGAMIPALIGFALTSAGTGILACVLFWLALKLLARAAAGLGRGIYRLFAGRKKTEVRDYGA